jgi:hypothetical protein
MWARGDGVTIFSDGQSMDAWIGLASPNGASLMVHFDGIFQGHIDVIPLLLGADGAYRSIVTNRIVAVEKSARPEQ